MIEFFKQTQSGMAVDVGAGLAKSGVERAVWRVDYKN